MDDFFREERKTDDRGLQSAALLGALEQFRTKRKMTETPRAIRNVLPLTIEEMNAHVELARQRKDHHPHAFESIRACLEHQLKTCKHPHHGRFCKECKRETVEDYSKFGETDTDIDFDPQTFVTTVIVRSAFKNVSMAQADEIRSMAEPPMWDHAAPTFFCKTECVVDKPTGRREYAVMEPPASGNGNGRASKGTLDYVLFEHVEWAWSPLLTGGIINLLNIKPPAPEKDQDFFEEFEKLGVKNPFVKNKQVREFQTIIAYEYGLRECLQSKFLGGWEPKGLDRDEGSYQAVWLPQKDDRGTLAIRAKKTIAYSTKAAELFPGMSALLNLLAPAVTSMLMNHLTYYGPCSFLAMKDGQGPKKKRAKPRAS